MNYNIFKLIRIILILKFPSNYLLTENKYLVIIIAIEDI